jgi:hypothetical protein
VEALTQRNLILPLDSGKTFTGMKMALSDNGCDSLNKDDRGRKMLSDNRSDVARILMQIEQEYQASKRGLAGLASGTARHDFISKKTENIGKRHEQLIELVGPEQAIALIATTIWTPTDQEAIQ